MSVLELLGTMFGIMGAILVTSNDRKKRFIAFTWWILSNVCLIIFFVINKHWGLVLLNSIYTVTSVIGWWNTRKD